MGKRRVKKTTKKPPPPSPANNVANGSDPKEELSLEQKEEEANTSMYQQVERQIAAIRAICDVETERLVNALRLLRSNFSKAQLQTPLLQFFKENLPNIELVRNEKGNINEVQWKENYLADVGGNIHASLLHCMSLANPLPSFGGFEFSSKAVKTSFFDAENLQMRDFVSEEPSSSQMLGFRDGLQTPGACGQRMSYVGMTPKTQRLPKKGEILLSVHGSPLGVYNEEEHETNDNMEAIHESEEG